MLSSAALLDGLDPRDVAALLPAFRFATVHVDQELITQGESGAAQMFIVLAGRFAVTRRHRGERVVTAVLAPGDSVGELGVFDPGRDTSTVRALTAARVAVLGGQDLLAWATTRPHAAAAMLHVLARRLHRTDAAVFDFAVLDVQGRVADALLDFAARFGEPDGSTVQVAHGLTQVQLAQLVGASRERVNKALADFASRGWLCQERRSVVLTDLPRQPVGPDNNQPLNFPRQCPLPDARLRTLDLKPLPNRPHHTGMHGMPLSGPSEMPVAWCADPREPLLPRGSTTGEADERAESGGRR